MIHSSFFVMRKKDQKSKPFASKLGKPLNAMGSNQKTDWCTLNNDKDKDTAIARVTIRTGNV